MMLFFARVARPRQALVADAKKEGPPLRSGWPEPEHNLDEKTKFEGYLYGFSLSVNLL